MSRWVMGSGSALERILHCAPSAVLPHQRETGEYAEDGNGIHHYLYRAPDVGRDAALAEVDEDLRDRCAMIDLDAIPRGSSGEVAFAYDLANDTARILGYGLGRHYGAIGPTEIPCTMDVVGVGNEGSVYVGDYKTGYGHVPPAARNVQLLFGALCAVRAFGKRWANVEIVRIRQHDGSVFRDLAVYSEVTLQDFWAELMQGYARVKRARQAFDEMKPLDTHSGPWCKYCPAIESCPSKLRLIRMLAVGELAYWEHTRPEKPTSAQMRQAYQLVRDGFDILKRVKSNLDSIAAVEPIDLGDGTLYGEVIDDGKETLNADTLWEVVRDLRGDDVAAKLVKRQATKAALRRALKPALRDGESMRDAEWQVIKEVRARGGSVRTPTSKLTEYPAGQEESAA